jgi:hypothetical protein
VQSKNIFYTKRDINLIENSIAIVAAKALLSINWEKTQSIISAYFN